MLIDQVRAFCIEHRLLEPGPLVVAVSGGADSLTLLHVLMALRAEFGLALHVATFDHRIRGPASAADVQFVQDVARAWGLPVTAGSEDVPDRAREESLNLEAAARKARYTFLVQVARQIGARQIALGHNQDDQAETVLMHVIRGAGLAGLRGMLPKTPINQIDSSLSAPLVVVRPLLGIPRAAIDEYLRTLGIEARIDQTNADTAYARNRIRREIMPLLETINPQARKALARTAEIARDEYEVLRSVLPQDDLAIERAAFLALPVAQQRLWIRRAAQRLSPGCELGADRTAAAIALIAAHDHGVTLPLGRNAALRVLNGIVALSAAMPYPAECPDLPPGSSLILDGPGVVRLPGERWLVQIERLPSDQPTNALRYLGPLAVVLDVPVGARLELRTRQPGDRFRPHGAGGHSQKLSDTLINMKVQASWRACIPLLTVNGEIAWFVAPCGAGPRSRVAEPFAIREQARGTIWRFTFAPAQAK
jgi:tRNA(Ile)-lysidine synthetase-like protein